MLVVVPARSGSKRVPGKNGRLLGGKPLICWTIEAALKAQLRRIVVSTDDKHLAEFALGCGAEVPFLRCPLNASDEASVIDVVLEVLDHFVEKGKHFDSVLLLQPTSPFRTAETIRAAIDIFDGKDSVISVSPARAHPSWCKRVKEGLLYSFDDTFDPTKRSQDLSTVYELNGSVYLASVQTLRESRSFYSADPKAIIIESEVESLDIDTPFDWIVAEAIVNSSDQAQSKERGC